jgi:hypothetical protein
MAGGTADSIKIGQNVILGGLVVQVIFFGFFMIVAVLFQTRLTRQPTTRSMDESTHWRKHMYVIIARCKRGRCNFKLRDADHLPGMSSMLRAS